MVGRPERCYTSAVHNSSYNTNQWCAGRLVPDFFVLRGGLTDVGDLQVKLSMKPKLGFPTLNKIYAIFEPELKGFKWALNKEPGFDKL